MCVYIGDARDGNRSMFWHSTMRTSERALRRGPPCPLSLAPRLSKALNADWTPPKPGGPNVNNDLNPLNLFFRLNLEEKDGWKPPMDGNKFPEAAQTWLKENKDKYRIKKFVTEYLKNAGK